MNITAIVCVHENLTWLPETLASIAAQVQPVQELILVKSQQTPVQADAMVAGFPNARVVVQASPGLAAARNLGILLSGGDVLAFLDSDDVWENNKTAIQLKYMSSEGVDAVVGSLVRFCQEGGELAARYPEGFFGRPVPAMTPGGLLIKKSALAKTGLLNERYRIACDHEWFMRLSAGVVLLKKTPEVVLHKRIHTTNLSRWTEAYRREIMQVLSNRNL